MAIPHSTTGSLGPAFAPARLVCLTVRLAYVHVLEARLTTGLSQLSHSSVTLWEDTAPVKLTDCHCPRLDRVRIFSYKGWCFIGDSSNPGGFESKSPTYSKHCSRKSNNSVQ